MLGCSVRLSVAAYLLPGYAAAFLLLWLPVKRIFPALSCRLLAPFRVPDLVEKALKNSSRVNQHWTSGGALWASWGPPTHPSSSQQAAAVIICSCRPVCCQCGKINKLCAALDQAGAAALAGAPLPPLLLLFGGICWPLASFNWLYRVLLEFACFCWGFSLSLFF